MEQVVLITTTTQDLLTTPLDHTTPQSLTTATQDLQLPNLTTIDMEVLHPLINHQVILEVGAVQGLHEAHHLQVGQVEEAAALREVKEVVHPLNQEEEDKPVINDYIKI